MDLYFMIRRLNVTIFLDAKETSTLQELKEMIAHVLKRPTTQFKLYFNGRTLDARLADLDKKLQDLGLVASIAKPHMPALIGMAFKIEGSGEGKNARYEPLEITEYSKPPELPDAMKSPDPSEVVLSPNN